MKKSLRLNNQPKEGLDVQNPNMLDVHSIFYTIQGEGPFVGTPAIFLRLAGCNLECAMCDTKYTDGRTKWEVDALSGALHYRYKDLYRSASLLVITGGEPFRQDLSEFIIRFSNKTAKKIRIQIETNGTLPPSERTISTGALTSIPHDHITIVCSPKLPTINEGLVPYIDAYKYVIDSENMDWNDGLPSKHLGSYKPARPPADSIVKPHQIYLSPMDTGDEAKNKENLMAARTSCLRFGYRMGVQLHKYLDLP